MACAHWWADTVSYPAAQFPNLLSTKSFSTTIQVTHEGSNRLLHEFCYPSAVPNQKPDRRLIDLFLEMWRNTEGHSRRFFLSVRIDSITFRHGGKISTKKEECGMSSSASFWDRRFTNFRAWSIGQRIRCITMRWWGIAREWAVQRENLRFQVSLQSLPGTIHKWRPHSRGHGKVDMLRATAWILWYKSVPNVDKERRGSNNPKILRTSLLEAPLE